MRWPRRTARRRLGRAGRRSEPDSPTRWANYLREIEPRLLARPRVHRFAEVPVIGEPHLKPVPLPVWIEGDEEPGSRTRASLAEQRVAPAAILTGSLREALAQTRASHVVLVQAGMGLARAALERLGQAAVLGADADVITCDDDAIDVHGRRSDPRLRPGPSPDRWLACDDSGALLVVRRERAAQALSRLDPDEAGWRHELALALAGESSRHHVHMPLLLGHRSSALPHAAPLAVDRVTPFARGRRVEQAGAVRRVRAALHDEPSVEVIICFRDKAELLARCVTSLLSRTAYDRFSLTLVDNGSQDAQALALAGRLSSRRKDVKLLRDARPFNFAALNNLAARGCTADVLLFLNNDTEIIDESWLESLVEEALRPEVGAVAPMLLYSDGTVQHAGAVVGLHGYAGHPFAGLAPDAETPFGNALGGTRNWLAVTAACMAVERRKFFSVGAFDDSFIVAGNDVDLCLRLTAAGYRSLCVPHATVVHDESRSRGRDIAPGDFVRSEQSYREFRTVGDPFYNPSLTLTKTDCGVRLPGEPTL